MVSLQLIFGVGFGFLYSLALFIIGSFIVSSFVLKRINFRNSIIDKENNPLFFYGTLLTLIILLLYLIYFYLMYKPTYEVFVSSIVTLVCLTFFIAQIIMSTKKGRLGVIDHVQVYGILYPISITGLLFFVLIFAGSAILIMGIIIALVLFSGIIPLLEEDFNLILALMVSLILSMFISLEVFNKFIMPDYKV